MILIGRPDYRSGSPEAKSGKTPGFLVRRESALRSFLASLAALCARPKLPLASKNLKYLYRDASLTGFRAPGAGFANSLFLHCALILGLIYIPMVLPTKAPGMSAAFLPPEVLFYPVPHTTQMRVCRESHRGDLVESPAAAFTQTSLPKPARHLQTEI